MTTTNETMEESSHDEQPSGDEGQQSQTQSSAPVPEAFQHEAKALVDKCSSEEMLDFLMDMCQKKQMEYMKQDQEQPGEEQEEFSAEDEPKD